MNKSLSVGLVLACMSVACRGSIGIPVLLNPTNGEEVLLPAQLVWQPVVEASGYRVEVDTLLTFSTTLVNEVSDTTYAVDFLETTMYYWRVAAYDKDDNLGEFCDIDSFSVANDSTP